MIFMSTVGVSIKQIQKKREISDWDEKLNKACEESFSCKILQGFVSADGLIIAVIKVESKSLGDKLIRHLRS